MGGGHTQHGAQLTAQQLGLPQAQADARNPRIRVVLVSQRAGTAALVGPRVERAQHERAAAELRGDRAVDALLLVLGRAGGRHAERGTRCAADADAVGAGRQRPRRPRRAQPRWPPPHGQARPG